MKVTCKTIKLSKEVNRYTKYIVYFPGNCENIGNHYSDDRNWCDENTVVDLCNYPYHSEWHNPGVLASSKRRLILNNIIALATFSSIGLAIYCVKAPLALAIPIFIVLGIAFLVTALLINNVAIRSNAKFYTRGEDSVAVGVKRVLNLLEKGVHPDSIMLRGYSIGGGVAASVYEKFASKGIYLRCQISASFSSIADVIVPIDDSKKESWRRKLVKYILKIGHWDVETYKIINSITPYTMFFNNEGDQVIKEKAQLVTKVKEMEKNNKNKNEQAMQDKIFEILFKKHTMLKPTSTTEEDTHCFPIHWLESAEFSDISGKDLCRLFTYLPYHIDVLRSRVGKRFSKDENYCSSNTNDENGVKMVKAVDGLLGALDDQELGKLKDLLNGLKGEIFLNKNQGYSKENFKTKLEELGKWVKKCDILFVDLDNSKNPDNSLRTRSSNPCAQLLSRNIFA
ncbi:MAG: hypothetical protein LBV62_04135 [Rickettsiales bacterium]|jgi:hypothetical protein|nr:hypothetical protein [Rickettsiales bacterium]